MKVKGNTGNCQTIIMAGNGWDVVKEIVRLKMGEVVLLPFTFRIKVCDGLK
ncbi:MAG: hypothetical protein ABFS18_10705 [Thermodesulfobacteriota bacterium]